MILGSSLGLKGFYSKFLQLYWDAQIENFDITFNLSQQFYCKT